MHYCRIGQFYLKTKRKYEVVYMQLEWKHCIKVGVTIFALFLGIHYWEAVATTVGVVLGAATPIIIGFVMAYIINILMTFYEKFYGKNLKSKVAAKVKTPVCMTLAMLTFVAIVSLIIWLVVPELVSCIQLLIAEIPPAMEALLRSEVFMELAPEDLYEWLNDVDWKSLMNEAAKWIQTGLGSTVSTVFSVVSSTVSGVVTGFISLIFAIYFLLGKEQLNSQIKRLMKSYLPQGKIDKINYVANVINDSFHRYIVGQCTEAIILGVLCMVGMMIFQFPYAGMIGALIGFTALIPVAGAYIGGVVGFIMIMTESPVKALLFIVFLLVLQQLEGNLIYPRVVGSSLGLPAVWVLAAVTVGGGLLGIIGMLIGVPIAAACYRLLKEDVGRREAKQVVVEEIFEAED